MSILTKFDSIPRLNQITYTLLLRRIEIYMKISIDSVKPEFFSDRFRDRENRLKWTIFRYVPKPLNSKFTKSYKNLTHPHFWLTSRLTGGDYPPIILERYTKR